MKRRLFKTLIVLALILVLVPISLTFIISSSWFRPKINSICSSFIENGDMEFGTVSVSLLEELPLLSIKLYDGAIHSSLFTEADSTHAKDLAQIPSQAHTPVSFKEIVVAVDIPSLIIGKIHIKKIKLSEPKIYGYIAPWGQPNWNIFAESDSPQEEIKLKFGVGYLGLRDAMIELNDASSKSSYSANIDSLNFILEDRKSDLYTLQMGSRANIFIDGKRYIKEFPLGIHGPLEVDITNPNSFGFDSTVVSIADSPIVLNGNVGFMNESIFSNIHCIIDRFHLGKLISYLDTEAFPVFEGMNTDLRLSFDIEALGRYDSQSGLLPAITAQIKIPEGAFRYPGMDIEIRKVGLGALLKYDPYVVDSTSVEIHSISLDATGLSLDGNGMGKNLINDPLFDLEFKGDIDVTKLSEIFLKEEGIIAKGDLSLDLKGRFSPKDLTVAQIGQIKAVGRVQTDNLTIDIPKDTISADLKGVSLFLGALENRRDTTLAQGAKTLQASFRADSANVILKDMANISISKGRAAIKSAAEGFTGDTSAIHPLKGMVEAKVLSVSLHDTLSAKGRDISLSASMYPSKGNPKSPLLSLNTHAKGLTYKDPMNFMIIKNGDIEINGTLRDTITSSNKSSKRDIDSYDVLGNEGDIDMSIDKSYSDLLERWDAICTIKADGGRLLTKHLPLRGKLGRVNLSISTEEVSLRNTEVVLGRSDLALTGKVSGIRDAITRKGKLSGELKIVSDTLDVNQLLKATQIDFDGDVESIGSVTSEVSQDTLQSPLILIPGNIDMKLGLFVGYGEYGNIALNGLSGEVQAKNRVLHIDDLRAITDAGELSLTALYSTKSKAELSAGFDMELRNIQVDKLIDLVPSVDTLVPMLKSLEGILDCELTATASLDTNMNISLPSLNGVARIKGEDMVLLDGETFTKVAKLLRFKNRERNMIDSISIEMIVKDNKVEMFPFVLKMDRIVAAASGIHNLDMSFNYHVSVIKSPLPIRIGVNVSGTFDDMKFKVGGARYKNTNIPSYTKVIDQAKLNLRKSISDIIANTNRNILKSELVKIDGQMEKELEVQQLSELSAEEKGILQEEGYTLENIDSENLQTE